MKKYFIYLLAAGLFSATTASSQADANANLNQASNGGGTGEKAFKTRMIREATNELFEIQGMGGTTFTSSNTMDGTSNSFKHSLQILIGLVPVAKTPNPTISFQLIFYSPNDNIQQAATSLENKVNIYFPIAVYDDIRSKLEQTFTARKKVTIKVVQQTNGYREGTIVF
ncbi:MAG: hypothetical protein SGI83_12885 [Bacteroidota bacterium]|nr:hypothetical protein [Bacteroidota bacterium]